jgi:UDPglucose 6-dehydrogenase
LVIVKSTVVPGTTQSVVKPALEHESGRKVPNDLGLVVNPEFLREGHSVADTLNPDRVVVGESDPRAGAAIAGMYRRLYGRKKVPIVRTGLVNAELIKYASNAFLATKVSFINTLADLAARTPGADIQSVAKGIGLDRRIGPLFLRAGLGYGGSCLPKDLQALVFAGRRMNADVALLEAVEQVNYERASEAMRLAKKHLRTLRGARVAVLGLSFKPDTDDIRDAVSLHIIDRLLREKARVVAYDPLSVNGARRVFGRRIRYTDSFQHAIAGADCCIFVTEWEAFRRLAPRSFAGMRNKVVIDGRRVLDASKFRSMERFEAIGLGPRSSP